MAVRISSEPLFDLFSYGRRAPGQRLHLTPVEIAQIERTVGRSPEVMVKVLSHGANNLRAVRRHLDYIGRKGTVELETDEGEALLARSAGANLSADWDLELDEPRRKAGLSPTAERPTRLVHKLVFSMPPGTPPDKVLAATRNFMREEFALQHRYVLALHTDEPHPHVHVVLKTRSEEGKRLNIRKAQLREWREGFALHLRSLGIEANATPRQLRGETAPQKPDGIFRTDQWLETKHLCSRAETASQTMGKERTEVEWGKVTLTPAKERTYRAWHAVAEALSKQGQSTLAKQVRRFADGMLSSFSKRKRMEAKLRD